VEQQPQQFTMPKELAKAQQRYITVIDRALVALRCLHDRVSNCVSGIDTDIDLLDYGVDVQERFVLSFHELTVKIAKLEQERAQLCGNTEETAEYITNYTVEGLDDEVEEFEGYFILPALE
jgi:hypothetical protein